MKRLVLPLLLVLLLCAAGALMQQRARDARLGALLRSGGARAAAGDMEGALAAYEGALAADPASVDAMLGAARACAATGRDDKAAARYEELAASKRLPAPLLFATHLEAGRLWSTRLDQPRRAIPHYEAAIALAPSSDDAPYYLLASSWHLLLRQNPGRREYFTKTVDALDRGLAAGLPAAHAAYLKAVKACVEGRTGDIAGGLEEALRHGLKDRALLTADMCLAILAFHRSDPRSDGWFSRALDLMGTFHGSINVLWKYVAAKTMHLRGSMTLRQVRRLVAEEPGSLSGPPDDREDAELLLAPVTALLEGKKGEALEGLGRIDGFFTEEVVTVDDIMYSTLVAAHVHSLCHLEAGKILEGQGRKTEAKEEYGKALAAFPASVFTENAIDRIR